MMVSLVILLLFIHATCLSFTPPIPRLLALAQNHLRDPPFHPFSILSPLPDFGLQPVSPPYTSSSSEDNTCISDLKTAMNRFLSPAARAFARDSGLSAIYDLGDYTGCVRDGGRFFIFVVVYGMPFIYNGLCLPARCSSVQLFPVQVALAQVINKMLPIKISWQNIIFADVDKMGAENASLETPGKITWALLGAMLAICILSTIFRQFLPARSFPARLSDCFHLWKNFKSITETANAVDPGLNVLNGVRVLGMAWIVLGHTGEVLGEFSVPLLNMQGYQSAVLEQRSYTMITSATLSVDVFFFLTAFLGILVCEHELKKAKTWIEKAKGVLMVYFYRAVRLWPLYGLSILVYLHVLKTLYDGPLSYINGYMLQNSPCYDNWYYNLLFVNNFVRNKETDDYCLGWSWYLANDFQLYLLVPILCILYSQRKLFGFLALAALFAISVVTQIAVFTKYEISIDIVHRISPKFWSKYYDKPYCRIAPFLLGVLFAWIYQAKGKTSSGGDTNPSLVVRANSTIRDNAVIRYVMYLAGIAGILYCVLAYFDFYKTGSDKTLGMHMAFAMVSRPLFVASLMLLLYPALLGKAALVRALLGHEIWTVLSKLTYATYLFHVLVVSFYYSSMHQSVYFTPAKPFIFGLETTVLSFTVAFFMSLVVEWPLTLVAKTWMRSRPAVAPVPATKKLDNSTLAINKE